MNYSATAINRRLVRDQYDEINDGAAWKGLGRLYKDSTYANIYGNFSSRFPGYGVDQINGKCGWSSNMGPTFCVFMGGHLHN